MRRLIFAIAATLLLPFQALPAQGQAAKPLCPLFTAIEFESGGSYLIDSYLSPWVYKGWNVAIGAEWMRSISPDNYRWVWQQQARLSYGRSHLRISGNGLTEMGDLRYSFGMMRHSNTPLKGLRLYYGANFTLTAAALYNHHGGNNPVSVKADLSLGLTGMAVYGFRIGRLPVTARYQASLPFVGVFAQPEYSESYYEIGLGNRKNFIHAGTWANKFDMANRLTIDLHLGSWALRIGYHNFINTTYTAGNRYQSVVHNFILGFAGDLLRWDSNNNNRPVIQALYAY